MKVLKLSLLLFLGFSSTTLFANEQESDLNDYISQYKQQAFEYDYTKNSVEGAKLRDSWIAPLQLNYSFSRSKPYEEEQQNESAAIKLDQPIFQSGGIYYGIKFAEANRRYSDFSVDVAKRKMIKDAVALLMQIKQSELKEQKQHLLIKNSEINLAQKKEEYLSGKLDSGFLDNAIIQRNIVIQTLYDLQSAKEKLITQFHSLSDLDYKKATIPHLEFISAKQFLGNNIVLKQKAAEIEKNRYAKDVRVAKYLPRLNLTAGYNWSKSSGQQIYAGGTLFDSSNELHYYDYGFRVNIPLDINTFRDIESAKVDYLKSKVLKEDKKRQLKALFEQVMHNIKNFNQKIKLSDENKKLYKKLLRDTKELYAAGYKTQYDVDTLQNSLKIQDIDTKIYAISKQLELLNLYEMYVNGGE
jgi:outer membrane protein TolC